MCIHIELLSPICVYVCEIVQKERTDFENTFIQTVVYKGL